MFAMKGSHPCVFLDPHQVAICHGRSRTYASSLSGETAFSKEIALIQYSYGCFFAGLGDDG